MKNKTKHIIKTIEPGSIAEELELEPGDELLRVNGEIIEDVFDYHFQTNDTYLELTIRKKDGEEWDLEIEKEYDEEIGITFENEFMDQYRSCSNNCIFCFIDQMPPGMRLAPINISFQTTNPELRCKMLHNRFAGNIFPKVQRLYEAGIEMNGQIVLCKGYNDGAELERSISDLSKYLPHLKSVSVVPVGLSKYRDGLAPLEPFTREDAKEVLATIHKWQKKLYEQWGLHFIHAGDEWYLLAEEPIPEEENYDGYIQLENGVGMLRLLEDEVAEELSKREGDDRHRHVTIATGKAAAPSLKKHMQKIREKYPNVQAEVVTIINYFFGESITVSGLITGKDLMEQLEGRDLGDCLLLPCNMLRSGKNVFLDDVTVEEVEERLKTPVQIIDEPGSDLVKAVVEENQETIHRRRTMYEQADCSNCGPAERG